MHPHISEVLQYIKKTATLKTSSSANNKRLLSLVEGVHEGFHRLSTDVHHLQDHDDVISRNDLETEETERV